MGGPRQRGSGRSLKDLKKELNVKHVNHERERLHVKIGPNQTNNTGFEPWTPSPQATLKILISARLGSAVWSGISDCDETYNYWEPAYQLLYGHGLQTWEYDPKFALRSYLYIMMHLVPAWVYAIIAQPNPMLVFYISRFMFGLVCALCEVYFYRGVLCEFGANVGRLCLCIMVCSAGMFISSTAFLPSTTSMYLTLLSMGAWFQHQYKLAIFCTAFSTFLSWPFAALIGLPIAIDIVIFKKQIQLFINWCVISAVSILTPQIICDSYYYGKPVFASLNIVMYNVFTSHGPDLYGTEPPQFYLINGFLNFNFVFILALLVLPVLTFTKYALKGEISAHGSGFYLSETLSQSPLYLWLLVFWSQPHKEERFLFPVYPLICLAGAMVIDAGQKLFYFLFIKIKSRHYLHHTTWLGAAAVAFTGLLSLSRIFALYQGYHGVTDVWMAVNQLPDQASIVCVGKEWYRFQSSFFFPSANFKLAFLKSEFSGQLPKYYTKTDAKDQLPTRVVSDDFNDMNLEEANRYIGHAGKCHFLVDLDNSEISNVQPSYAAHSNWTIEAQFEYLNPAGSNQIFRAFYIPFISRKFTKFDQYLLLRRVSPRRLVPSED